MMKGLLSILILLSGIIPKGEAFLEPLQKRDSILVADQISYGFIIDSLDQGDVIALPDYSRIFDNDTLVLVDNWKVDTLKVHKLHGKQRSYKIRGRIVLAPFEEGEYVLPLISVQYTSSAGDVDTLLFDPQVINVTTLPVDPDNFEINDIKGQMRYPVTFEEVYPYGLGLFVLASIIIAVVCIIRIRRNKADEDVETREPAYITALRKLEQYRGDKYWMPEKQKQFYSGITDTLRAYIANRFGIEAKEMTTAEIFNALKNNSELTPELYSEAKELFETADFVKFAKHIVSDDENAKVVPSAVRFVTSTYRVEEETKEENVL